MLSDGSNYYNQLRIKSAQLSRKCSAIELSYLFPFCTSCQKSDQSRWNPHTLRDLGSVVDELIGAELENEQASNEGGDVEANIVVVDHVEKSVIAWRNVQRGERGWRSREGEASLKQSHPISNLGAPQTIGG